MVKKGEEHIIQIEDVAFPNRGFGYLDDKKIIVHNTLAGQEVRVRIKKKRKSKIEATLLEVVSPAPNQIDPPCPVFGICGGCTYQHLDYTDQLTQKETFITELLKDFVTSENYEGILPSPDVFFYRNKMEFSFGDEYINGPLTLGLHKRGSMYDIVDASQCMLVDEDFNKITKRVLSFCRDKGYDYFHKKTHTGFLRHLVVRKGIQTGEILVELVTSSDGSLDQAGLLAALGDAPFKGTLKSVLHTVNDSMADVVQSDQTHLLLGEGYIYDELNGLRFQITPRSFFQTNTLGARVLYDVVSEYAGDDKEDQIFDLYSGTGTITQILARDHAHVTGVEIVSDAVDAAIENARMNGIENADFLCGDVMEVVATLEKKPDVIILDPPRDGIHPKAIQKVIDFMPKTFVYVSCKPTSLVRDLPYFLEAGYALHRIQCVDLFPHTPHVETVVLLTKKQIY
ncbi:23S rRNA (uracil(1939)-C(5))-methyltransferase RlmD [Alkalibacter rhizosphaerae]|uniref:23S rRNA (Uracil(1939)-C(5))-methyltransferase RlmD n=1 Tax=Alkalibacter rhizosphaerae TaxID=2815577 RepID=A0A974XEV5_9FIRM|nr:23S rRNA (uracil(1939)-C(5))-methyltransferase RlmD [Alkalibacter rhizosphaerae]QSX08471.1 23S rRNA (uracil(1939)-C(5))-methyltransferase RlmD [Alkalibacter rhizosphaerae]